jgi:hypothetical protein
MSTHCTAHSRPLASKMFSSSVNIAVGIRAFRFEAVRPPQPDVVLSAPAFDPQRLRPTSNGDLNCTTHSRSRCHELDTRTATKLKQTRHNECKFKNFYSINATCDAPLSMAVNPYFFLQNGEHHGRDEGPRRDCQAGHPRRPQTFSAAFSTSATTPTGFSR